MQLLPLLGAGLLVLLRTRRWAPYLGQAVAALELGLASLLAAMLDRHSAAMQFAERAQLLGPLDYHAAADGVTVPPAVSVIVLPERPAIVKPFAST